MTIAQVIDAMLSIGCTTDQIAAMSRIFARQDEARQNAKREAAKTRQQRHRAALSRLSRVTHVTDVPDLQAIEIQQSVTAVTRDKRDSKPSRTRAFFIGEEVDIDSPSGANAPQPPRGRRAVRLTAEFQLTTRMRDYSRSKGWTDSLIDAEGERMRDWSMSSPKGAKLDWEATWRTWVGRRDGERQANGQKLNGHRRPTISEMNAEFLSKLRGESNEPTGSAFDGITIDGVVAEFPDDTGGASKRH